MPIPALPTEFKMPLSSLSQYTYMFAGDKKVGKTSFCSQFDKHFILEFEPGNADHLVRNSVDVHNWVELEGYIALLQQNPNYCKTLIIDDVPTMYRYCIDEVKRHMKVQLYGKLDFAGWAAIRDIFTNMLDKILKLSCGKIFTAHTETSEIVEQSSGKIYHRIGSNLSNQCNDIMASKTTFDVLLLRESNERIMVLEGDSVYQAGHGLYMGHFMWNGRHIKKLPMGKSPKEAFSNFNKAFENKLPVPDRYLIKES